MRICPESFRTCANSNWTTCRHMCSCCGLESVRGQVRMPSFGMRRRLPIGSRSTARLDNKSCDCGVVLLLLNIFVLSCALADPIITRRCCFRTELSWFVVTVPMMLFGHHRRHKLACCTGVAFDVVVFLSFCFVHFAQRRVCPLRGLPRCRICSFVLGVSNRLTLYRRISVTSLCVRSEFSECIPLRPVLRDVASLVQFWGTSENIRLQSVISLFRFVASFAVLQTCVRRKHGRFVSGGTQSID